MSKKRDIYNEMDSEDPFAEDYSSYYGEDVPEPEEEMPEAVDGGAFIDDEAEEEDPYADYPYPEDGPYDYIDPYDPRLQEYLMSSGYMRRGGSGTGKYREDYDLESDESVTSSSSSSSSDSSSEEESSDSSSEERVTRKKPKKTFRAKAKAKKGKQNTRRKKK